MAGMSPQEPAAFGGPENLAHINLLVRYSVYGKAGLKDS